MISTIIYIACAIITAIVAGYKFHESERRDRYPIANDADSWQSWSFVLLIATLVGSIWPLAVILLFFPALGWLVSKYVKRKKS